MTLQVINFSSKEDYERALKMLGLPDYHMIVTEEECDEFRRRGMKFVAGDIDDWLVPNEETEDVNSLYYRGEEVKKTYRGGHGKS